MFTIHTYHPRPTPGGTTDSVSRLKMKGEPKPESDNPADASTAGIVIIMAHSCPQVIGSVDDARLKRSWERCVEILQHLSTYNVPSKNQLNLLQRAYAQRVSDQPFPNSTSNPRQNRSGVQQPTSMLNASQSWDQPAQSGSALESQGVDNYLSGNDGMTDFAAEGFGFFDSMNFFEGGFPNFVSG